MPERISCGMTLEEILNICREEKSQERIPVRIINKESELYFTVDMLTNGIVTQQVYFNNKMQLWTIEPVEDVYGYYKIRSAATGGVITGSESSAGGMEIRVGRDQNLMTQEWAFIGVNDGVYLIKNRFNKLVLDIPRGTGAVGIRVQEYSQNNGDNQKFSLSNILYS